MGYFAMLKREFRWWLTKLEQLPRHPYSPFYASWEYILQERTKLLRQQAEEARRMRELGVVATWDGWVLVVASKGEPGQPLVEVRTK